MATAAKAATTRTVKKVSVFSSQSRPMMLTMEKTMTTATFTAKVAAGAQLNELRGVACHQGAVLRLAEPGG